MIVKLKLLHKKRYDTNQKNLIPRNPGKEPH